MEGLYKRSPSKKTFKSEMSQTLNDLENNDASEIQMRRATLEFEQDNQHSTNRTDKKVRKFLIIILPITLVFCLITWIIVGRVSDQEFVQNRTVTSTENLFDDLTENLTDLVDIRTDRR